MTLNQVKELVYSRLLSIQRLRRLVDSDIFERAYSEDCAKIISLVKSGDTSALRSLVQRLGTIRLSDKPIMELRRLGRKYGIKGYNNMPKTHLIEEIENAIGRTPKTISSGDETIHPDVRG